MTPIRQWLSEATPPEHFDGVPSMNKTQIQYLNTDLDLVCDVDPSGLAREFENRNLVAHVTPGEDG